MQTPVVHGRSIPLTKKRWAIILAKTSHAADASGKAWGDALQRVRQMEESQFKNNSTKPSEAAVDTARDQKTEHDRTEPIQRKCYNNYK